MEANMQVLEGAQYRLRVKLTNQAGEQLPPEHFRVYAGAFCPGRVPAHFRAERTADEWVLTMPGLKPGRVPWNWQLLAAEYATGVEWLLAAGEVTVTPRHATGSGCVDPGELKIVATLDKTTLEMTVQIGESTAACSLAVVAAQNSAKAADTSAKAAANSAEHAAEQAQAAEQAKNDALAAQSTADAQAAIAKKAAADAQAPESIAAQAARPATMLLVRDELLSLLGDASLFDIDTDGQKIIVHTDRLSEDKLAAVNDVLERFVPGFIELVQYNHNMEISWRDINKYAECTNIADMLAVNPDYKNDLTSDGEWVYPLPEMVYAGGKYPDYQGIFYRAQKIKKIKLVLPKAKSIGYSFNSPVLEELDIEVPIISSNNYVDIGHIVQGSCSPKKFRCVAPLHRNFNQFLWNNSKQKHLKLYAPNMRNGTFEAQLDKESALGLMAGLGVFANETNTLTIGIHIDYQNDPEVLAAISDAEAKGWTLTVRWNGTATAAASVMRFSQLIYAKVGEMEMPDGTTERVLDWGHYVTNEEGYETFRSLESAYEYFGLPMPEESFS